MQTILTHLAASAVAMLYYLWRTQYQVQQRRRRILCRGSFVRYPPRSAESVFQPLEDRLTRDAQRRADLPQR